MADPSKGKTLKQAMRDAEAFVHAAQVAASEASAAAFSRAMHPASSTLADRRKNEIEALLSGYWARADQAWLDALLKVSDEASDADKDVMWLTCREIAYLRGWHWSHGEGRWVRRAAPDGQIPDSGPSERQG